MARPSGSISEVGVGSAQALAADSRSGVTRPLSTVFVTINFGPSGSSNGVNFCLATKPLALFCVVEPYFGRMVLWVDDLAARYRAAFAANAFLLRSFLNACGLFLFIMSDDGDTQFIHFPF